MNLHAAPIRDHVTKQLQIGPLRNTSKTSCLAQFPGFPCEGKINIRGFKM